jgi:hypothetical protein
MYVTVDGQVVGRSRGGHRFLKPKLWLSWWNIINWRPGGTLKWKAEDHWLGREESVIWKVGPSKIVAPRLCRLRTDGLAPVSKY